MSYSIYGHDLVYGSEKFEITTYEDGAYERINARKDSGTDKDGNALTQITFSCPERKKSDDDKIEYSKRIYFINDKKVGFDLREYDPTSHSFEQVNVNSDGFIKGTVTFKSSNAVQTENDFRYNHDYLQYSEERNDSGEIVKIVSNLPTKENDDLGVVTTYFNSDKEICRQLVSTWDNEYTFEIVVSEGRYAVKETKQFYYEEIIDDDFTEETNDVHYVVEKDYSFAPNKAIVTISHSEADCESNKHIDNRIEYDFESGKITVITYHDDKEPSIEEYDSIEEYNLKVNYIYDESLSCFLNDISLLDTKSLADLKFTYIFKIIDEDHIDVICPCFSHDGVFSMQVEEKYETKLTDSTFIYTHSMLNDNGDFDETTTIDYLGEMSENGVSPIIKTETYKNGNLTACEDYEDFTYESYEHDDK